MKGIGHGQDAGGIGTGEVYIIQKINANGAAEITGGITEIRGIDDVTVGIEFGDEGIGFKAAGLNGGFDFARRILLIDPDTHRRFSAKFMLQMMSPVS